jgi:hypothetical protein
MRTTLYFVDMLWLIREQPEGARTHSRLRAIVHSEFGEQTTHMTFDCLDCDYQGIGNLLVRVALGEQVEHLAFARADAIRQQWLGSLYCSVFLCKGCQQPIQVRGWPLLLFPFSQGGEQGSYRRSFIDESADVALGLSQAHGLSECADSGLFFPPHLPGQGLQDQQLDDVLSPVPVHCPFKYRGQKGKRLLRFSLDQPEPYQRALLYCSCHGSRRFVPALHLRFEHMSDALRLPAPQPEAYLRAGEKHRAEKPGILQVGHQQVFSLLQG